MKANSLHSSGTTTSFRIITTVDGRKRRNVTGKLSIQIGGKSEK